MTEFDKSIYTPFTKVEAAEDGTAKVYGLVSSPVLDLDQQITDADWFKSAVESDYRYWLNVREMHQPIAAGHGIDIEYDGDSTYMTAIIDDLSTAKKCISGTLKGFSYGLKRPVVDRSPAALTKAPNGIIKGGTIVEVSVVDRPANPDATFTLVKMAAEELQKRDVSESERADLADEGKALPDGSFPIASKADLRNAIQAYGRAKDKAAAKAHIIKRAKALGATDMLPADWEGSTKEKLIEGTVGGTFTIEPILTKGEPDPKAQDVYDRLQVAEMDDAQLALAAANIVRYMMIRELHEAGTTDGEMQYYMAQLAAVYDTLMACSRQEAAESWEYMVQRQIQGLVTSHTLDNVLAEISASPTQLSQQPSAQEVVPSLKRATLDKVGAKYSADTKTRLKAVMATAIDLAKDAPDVMQEGHNQMKAMMPDVCDMGKTGDNEMDKAAVEAAIAEYLAGQPELVKAADATESLRSEVEALKAEVAEISKRAQPASVWQGGAQPRPEPNSERALYQRLALSENPAIQHGAEKWLDEHP